MARSYTLRKNPGGKPPRKLQRKDLSQASHGSTMEATGPETGVRNITPADERGGRTNFGASDESLAYFTAPDRGAVTDRDPTQSSWHWARAAARRQSIRQDLPGGGWRAYLGRPIVHSVEPHGTVDVDRNFDDIDSDALTASNRLEITATHWTPPARKGEVVQGTLSHVNWNQFASDGSQHNFKVIDVPPPGTSERIPTTGDEERARVKAQRSPTDPRQGTLL